MAKAAPAGRVRKGTRAGPRGRPHLLDHVGGGAVGGSLDAHAARAEIVAEIAQLAGDFEQASTIANPAAKKTLAELCATLVLRHRTLSARDIAGELSPEVARTLGGMASNIKRLLSELGLTPGANKPGKKRGGFLKPQ